MAEFGIINCLTLYQSSGTFAQKSRLLLLVQTNKCYEDDVIIVKNGMEATSLNGWESIDFNKIHNCVTSGKAKPSKRGNIVESYGYLTASYDKVIDSDGLHPPYVKSNTIN
jgi:hypothetical protein